MDKRTKTAPGKPQITVVIGTLNRPKIVLKLLSQLQIVKSQIEVLVIDQSDNADYKLLKDSFPQADNFKLIHFDKANTCKYLNYGLQNARADIVLYLDDDVTITDKTVDTHIKAYDNPQVMGVAGAVINDGESVSKNGVVGRVQWYGAVVVKNFTYDKRTVVEFPYGCNMSFRKKALEELGGFDERLEPPMYSFNELDIGVRLNKVWHDSMIFLPEALVYHHQYRTGGTRNKFSLAEVTKGNSINYGYFVGKNYNAFENLIFLIRRLPYQLLREPGLIAHIIKGFIKGKKARGRDYV